jgi:hypothetical protein
MNRSKLWLVLSTALALLVPSGAMAQRDRDWDWYRDIGPWLGRGGEEGVRRARLSEQYVRLRAEVRRAERRGQLRPRDADRYYDRLDRVARFMRDDRNLTSKEYNRRQDDLEKVARDLERATGYRYGRNDRR